MTYMAGTQLGALSTEILNTQKALLARGFDPGPLDGKMGPKTKSAIMAFQRAAGLKVDGIVGPLTTAALFKSSPSSSPLPVGTGTPKALDAIVASGTNLLDAASAALRAVLPSEKPKAIDVGSPVARDAYNDTPMTTSSLSWLTNKLPTPDSIVQTAIPTQTPTPQASGFPAWVLPVVAGLGVFMLASAKGAK